MLTELIGGLNKSVELTLCFSNNSVYDSVNPFLINQRRLKLPRVRVMSSATNKPVYTIINYRPFAKYNMLNVTILNVEWHDIISQQLCSCSLSNGLAVFTLGTAPWLSPTVQTRGDSVKHLLGVNVF